MSPSAGLSFTRPEPPPITVVISFHNEVDMTLRCLECLHRWTHPDCYEVVLVDDGSVGVGASALAGIPGITFVSSEHERGRTRSANLGARHASGRHLVFLDNDCEVTSGWLDALIDGVTSGEAVAAVGAMHRSADGTLLEAGTTIWADGSGVSVAAGGDVRNPLAGFRREVDSCSTACLLVDRMQFEGLGGFDESYAPGPYGAMDLCAGLQAAGKVVLYEPDARIVHVGGTGPGTATTTEVPAGPGDTGQELNRLRFQAKWAEDLLLRYPPGTAGGLRGGRIPSRPKVLVCDDTMHPPDRDAGGLRLSSIMALLHGMGCDVTYSNLTGAERRPFADQLRRAGIEVCTGAADLADLAGARTGLYDVVILSRTEVADRLRDLVRFHFPTATVVFDTVDLHFVREGRRMAMAGTAAQGPGDVAGYLRARRRELDQIRAADVVGVVTDEERIVVESLVPGAEVVVLPTVHPIRPDAVPGPQGRAGMVFIGSYLHLPNVDAVTWFASEVMPLLGGVQPLWALGSDPPPVVTDLASDRIIVPGYLADVDARFDAGRVFVSPLRYGAGMKGKIGQAMALGLPVVTTSIGAEGMGLRDGVDALIADEAGAFAEAVVRLATDDELWSTISGNARRRANELWRPAVMADRLHDLLGRAGVAGRLSPRSWRSSAPLFGATDGTAVRIDLEGQPGENLPTHLPRPTGSSTGTP